jgi:probable F420-dependent oxidoreductase
MKIGCMPADAEMPFQAMRSLALAAEEAGFASFWLPDHLIHRSGDTDGGMWEAFTYLSGLAAVTSRITLGPLVACTSFRNPGLLAKMATTLDEVSGGRSVLGLGAGWHEPEYAAFGYPFDHRVGRFEEAVQVIVPLLRGETVSFSGQYVQIQQARLLPRGPSPKGPPILIAGKGPRMLRLTATYADAWNTAWHVTPAAAQTRIAEMLAACQEVGRDPATLEVTVGISARILAPGENADPAGRAITGTAEAVTQTLRSFAAVGAQHLIVVIPGTSPAQLARFAPVIAALADA